MKTKKRGNLFRRLKKRNAAPFCVRARFNGIAAPFFQTTTTEEEEKEGERKNQKKVSSVFFCVPFLSNIWTSYLT
jgi:hypothetical protein